MKWCIDGKNLIWSIQIDIQAWVMGMGNGHGYWVMGMGSLRRKKIKGFILRFRP